MSESRNACRWPGVNVAVPHLPFGQDEQPPRNVVRLRLDDERDELEGRFQELERRYKKELAAGLDELLPEAFATVREACRRLLGATAAPRAPGSGGAGPPGFAVKTTSDGSRSGSAKL